MEHDSEGNEATCTWSYGLLERIAKLFSNHILVSLNERDWISHVSKVRDSM